ncbi:DUF58 domain-containing protein [Alkalihalobacillus pseudalcaliphilus]|uniref:DUF58 domain-containing protein n=1 Tax=Alkalihalobacillus pseudalcaliphilus TaxID=79884 RepID=UPI00064DD35F|nr:DUF58 domain-containing protein [Alkalihalobacillus pseudalcaliphilus]KMK75067.1 hypothetical protein AB990_16525 [Alkalihalobacillus pseudalcaliphilus]
MTKRSKNWWDRLLFRDKGFLPTWRFVICLAGLSLILFIFSHLGLTWPWVIAVYIIFLLVSLADLLRLPAKKELELTREIPNKLERNLDYEGCFTLTNYGKTSVDYRVIDGLPQSFSQPFPIYGHVGKGEAQTVQYPLKAPVRGDYEINELFVRYRSKMGLWERQNYFEQKEYIKVIPDITEMKAYLESAQRYLNDEGAIIKKQVSGVGEFSKVRNYVVGDDPRMINWRQTAKLREVMTNEYEPEHGKYITLLIDCGRMMGTELKTGNRLEKAIEATLTVAAAALKKGDYVAVIAFSKKVSIYIPPQKGLAHLQTILDQIYDLQVEPVESNYGEVFHYLETAQKKRSLILLFSDIRTFLYEESALHYLTRIRRRHRFLMIGVEDQMLNAVTELSPETVQEAMTKSMAQQQALFKRREQNRWEKQGLEMVEVQEEHIAVTAVSSYINMLNRGLI